MIAKSLATAPVSSGAQLSPNSQNAIFFNFAGV